MMRVFIRIYQYVLSPILRVLGARCRFFPSCSQYAYLAFTHYPWWTAVQMSLRRLWRCQPWYQEYQENNS